MSILGIALPLLGVGGGVVFFILKRFFPLAFKAIGAFLAAVPTKVWIGLAVVAAVLGAFLYVRHLQGEVTSAKTETAAAHKETADERAAHAITKASLAGARAEITANNARVAAAGAELQRERQEAAANEVALNERYKAVGASVKRLEASAATKGLPPCKVSQEAAHALDGL